MRDKTIINNFEKFEDAIKNIQKNLNESNKVNSQYLQQINDNLTGVSLYLDSLIEYRKKYWILPIGFWPGKKLFDKIYKNNLEEVQKKRKEQMKKQQEKAKEKMKEQQKKAKKQKDKDTKSKKEKESSIILPGGGK